MQRSARQLALHVWLIFLALSVLVPLLILETGRRRSATSDLTPAFSHAEGYYDRDVKLKIDVSHPEAVILFTTDGQVPTPANSTRYTRPIRLSASSPGVTVIRARALLPDGELGPIANASYFVGLRTGLPMLSLIVDPADLWDSERGIYANPEGRGTRWERPVDLVYLETAEGSQRRRVGFHVPAGLRIHGGTTRLNLEKKSLRLYFRQEYGLNRLDYPLSASGDPSDPEGVPSRPSSFKRLVVHSGGQDFSARNWTLMRIPLMNDLAEPTDSYTTLSRPVLLTINGDPQGIFHLRTYIDDWLFADQFGIETADFLDAPFAPFHAGLPLAAMETLPPLSDVTAEQQAGVIWERTLRFMQTADLAQPE
ncbi:MAG: chitobiase/beta-hexosaminidase C-terminal domain-containing protein, partial [Anaerolineae bacterium]